MQDCLYLGNLDSKRDWGHAKDYVEVHGYHIAHDYSHQLHHVRDYLLLNSPTTAPRLPLLIAMTRPHYLLLYYSPF